MYVQGATNVTRMDYLSPLHNELVFALAVEELLGVEIPPRATWIRMLMCELEPHLLPRHVGGDERHGPRVDDDDDLRLPRARPGAHLLREGDRAADEPQLHPPGGRRRRPARRVGGRRHGDRRHDRVAHRRLRRAAHRTADLPGADRGRRRHRPRARAGAVGHRADPARRRGALGPSPDHAVPRLRRGRLRRDRRHGRRHLRPLRRAAERDPRVDPDRPPGPRADAAPATTGSRTRRSRHRPGHASTSRWRRSSTTSSCSPAASRCRRARPTSPSSRPGASSAATWSRTARTSPYRMHIRGPSFVNLQSVPALLRGALLADAIAILSSVDPVLGEVDR